MALADPWDEIARLEKQMDAEILAQMENASLMEPRARRRADEDPIDGLGADL